MTFNPRTATPAEFEAEARRTHKALTDRIAALTPHEREACEKMGMSRMLKPALHLNALSMPLDTFNDQIAECVRHFRNDTWQSSDEYNALFRGSRPPTREAIEEARVKFYARWDAPEAPKPVAQASVGVEKKGRDSWIVVDGQPVGRARSKKDAERIAEALKG